ncbi:hypothetical protein Zmor_006274 [Zophobas morio]|uniref:YqaJ viral recombinase domain-containing protein n=1 Tax=Zophobas morio TaxID=2755281 RepID=A0AA38MN85_9CUCU|nr:hypothetical protein Zmor_006274 [Zophobas morio]
MKKKALEQLSKQENVIIQQCGLFIHEKYYFLGGTPDGIINDDFIVGVKCPFPPRGMHPEEAIQNKKIKFWIYNKKIKNVAVNVKQMWYYQVQGQLQITNRKGCLFGVWTGNNIPIKVAYIRRNDQFRNEQMLKKLCTFYHKYFFPELVGTSSDTEYAYS